MTTDRRLSSADEPPFDADYDTGPPTIEVEGRVAERYLLASLLVRPEDAGVLLPALDPTDFYNPTFERIWETAADLYADGTTPDHLALLSALAQDKNFHRFGGPNLLLSLRDEAPHVADPARYARSVRNAARWRRAGAALQKALHAHRQADPSNLEEVLAFLSDEADRAATDFGPRGFTPADTGLHDLSWIRDGRPPETPAPVYGRRTDDTALFYRGRVNGLFGDPESGKTWLAQIAIIEALQDGERAAMIDVDHNGADHTAARLLLLGARPEWLYDHDRFRYYEPEDADQLKAAVRDITTWQPEIFLLDSLGEVLPMLGVKSVDNDEITAALRTVVNPPATAGSCVITIDHLPKSVEARATGFAIGGTAKKRAIDGAYIRVESKTKPAPGQIGRATLRIEKDRTGQLRKTSAGGYAGELTLDSSHEGITRFSINRDAAPIASDGSFRPTETMEKVSRFVEENDQATGRDIAAALGGKHQTVNTAVQILVAEGFLSRVKGPRNSWLHHAVALYRQTEDDHLNPPEPGPWS